MAQQKECKWGTSVGMFYTFVVDVLDPYLWFHLDHGNVEEDSNGQCDDDLELLRSFEMS